MIVVMNISAATLGALWQPALAGLDKIRDADAPEH